LSGDESKKGVARTTKNIRETRTIGWRSRTC